MSQKIIPISEQIAALESDLSEKNKLLKAYDRTFNTMLKSIFGMDKAGIEKLIAESRKNAAEPADNAAAEEGVVKEKSGEDFSLTKGNSSPYHFGQLDAARNDAQVDKKW